MELLTPDQIICLTPGERLALIAQFRDSLEQEQLPLTTAQDVELERRVELIEAQAWYEGEATGLGRRFRHAIDARIEWMSDNPGNFPSSLRMSGAPSCAAPRLLRWRYAHETA